MGTFSEDLWGNFVNRLEGNLALPSGISAGYSSYVAMTNIFLGGSYVGKGIQVGRTLESYREMAKGLDALTLKRIEELINDLEKQKIALHS